MYYGFDFARRGRGPLSLHDALAVFALCLHGGGGGEPQGQQQGQGQGEQQRQQEQRLLRLLFAVYGGHPGATAPANGARCVYV